MAHNIQPKLSIQSLTVEQLVLGLRGKTPEVISDYFEELIRRFEPLLRRAWRRKAFSTDYAEYAQDVFLTLFRRLPQLRSPRAFPGYFRRVALSVAADHARKSIGIPVQTNLDIENLVDEVDDALFTSIFVRSYLEHLPSREKKILTLLYLEDNSIFDVANVIGITPSAVRSVKARGLRRLRDILLENMQALEKK